MKKHGTRSVDSEHNYKTLSLCLVARLMGLESMPAIREKPKKVSFFDTCDNGEKTFVNDFSGNDDMNLEGGSMRGQVEGGD